MTAYAILLSLAIAAAALIEMSARRRVKRDMDAETDALMREAMRELNRRGRLK